MSDRHAAPEADVTGWDAVDTDATSERIREAVMQELPAGPNAS